MMHFPTRVFLCTLLFVGSYAHASDGAVGQVVSVSGKVLVRMESAKTMQMIFLKAGDRIVKGSVLNTGPAGAAKLMMSDKTIVDLGPSTLFKVNEYELKNVNDRNVDLSVEHGTVRASVNQKVNPEKGKFTIRTKAATMGVRGTEFVIHAGTPETAESRSAATSVTVIKGQVEVSDLKAPNTSLFQVKGGSQFTKEGSNPAIVTQLEGQKIIQIRSDAFQKDTTFMKTVVVDQTTGQATHGERSSIEKPVERPAPRDARQEKAAPLEVAGATEERPPAQTIVPPPPPGNLTMAGIATNVSVTTSNVEPLRLTDFRAIGMPPPPLAPTQGVQIIQGLPKNLRVIFTP